MNATHATPINKQAAISIQSGVEYVCPRKKMSKESPVPFRIKTTPDRAQELTGVRFGRLTVLGFAMFFKGMWCVRCDCGTYALRKSRAVTNPKNKNDRCEECRHLAQIQNSDHFRRTGKDLPGREL